MGFPDSKDAISNLIIQARLSQYAVTTRTQTVLWGLKQGQENDSVRATQWVDSTQEGTVTCWRMGLVNYASMPVMSYVDPGLSTKSSGRHRH